MQLNEPLVTITVEAYGKREQLVFMGGGDHHRVPGVIDQAKADGEALMATLDDMRLDALLLEPGQAVKVNKPVQIHEGEVWHSMWHLAEFVRYEDGKPVVRWLGGREETIGRVRDVKEA